MQAEDAWLDPRCSAELPFMNPTKSMNPAKVTLQVVAAIALSAGSASAFETTSTALPLQSCSMTPSTIDLTSYAPSDMVTGQLTLNPDPAWAMQNIYVDGVLISHEADEYKTNANVDAPAGFLSWIIKVLYGATSSLTVRYASAVAQTQNQSGPELCSATYLVGSQQTAVGFYAPLYSVSPQDGASTLGRKVGLQRLSGVNYRKAGSTVPFKWEIFNGTAPDSQRQGSLKMGPSYPVITENEVTDIAAVQSIQTEYFPGSCADASAFNPGQTISTGWRYDSVAGQFIFNWKAPSLPGCYKVTMTTTANASVSANIDVQ